VRHGNHACGVDRAHLFDDVKKAVELAQQTIRRLRFELQAGQLRQTLYILGSQGHRLKLKNGIGRLME